MLADDWVIRIVRGRQEVGREQMVTSQRVQLLDAMAKEVAENGYAGITADAIAARAGTSSEVFHQHFQDTESCFMAAYDLGVEVLATTIEDGLGSPESPPLARFERSLSSYLDLLATEPSFARTFLIEVWAAGPRAVQRRLEGVRRFTALITGVLNPPVARMGSTPLPARPSSARSACWSRRASRRTGSISSPPCAGRSWDSSGACWRRRRRRDSSPRHRLEDRRGQWPGPASQV